jgi:hypothetical protein
VTRNFASAEAGTLAGPTRTVEEEAVGLAKASDEASNTAENHESLARVEVMFDAQSKGRTNLCPVGRRHRGRVVAPPFHANRGVLLRRSALD